MEPPSTGVNSNATAATAMRFVAAVFRCAMAQAENTCIISEKVCRISVALFLEKGNTE